QAMETLDAAAARARQVGERHLMAEVEASLARAAAEAGAEELSATHRRRARAIFDRIGVSLPPELRDAFWAHPLRAPLLRRALSPGPRGTRLPAERLLEINKRLNSSLSTARVLEHAIDAAIELTAAERGFILLRSETDGSTLEVAVARNLDRERVGRSHLKFSRSIAEQVAQSAEPLLTTDARDDERFRDNASVHAMRLTSVVCVPIASPEGVLGAIYLDNRFERGRFSEADLRTLVACADQVALALTNARLHAALARRTQALEQERARVQELLREREAEVLRLEARALTQRDPGTRYTYEQIIGRGPAMRELLATLDRVIDSPLSVLIQGESGTGKELVARAIHFSGARRERPFVTLNCAALPDALLEGELFGWVKGAFTGADRDKQGLLAGGRGGSVFLDEIGETSAAMQAKLLRVLQEGELRPLGSTETLELDIRVIAATNRSLRDEVAAGRFREDLYYRLAVVELRVPPLRDRREDIAPIAADILRRLAEQLAVELPELHPDARRALLSHAWPGNVRELENVLSRAVVMSDGVLRVEHLGLPERGTLPRSRGEFQQGEAERILRELQATEWNISEVGRRLGIPRNSLYRKLARYGIARRSSGG
ncbi:MAG: GAF domain-containing protein, partial [Deltaproteobacteria bacterium]|nr:GAF domain-containing protein [Deltaproteobacteria bacterium]